MLSSLAVLTALAGLAPAQSEEPGGPRIAPRPEPFGREGQIVITGGLANLSISEPFSDEDSYIDLQFGPAASYFVLDDIAVRGALRVGYQRIPFVGFSPDRSPDPLETWYFGIGGGVAYHVAVSDSLSLWPQFALFYERFTTSNLQRSSVKPANSLIAIELPLLVHVAEHFFFAMGVSYSQRIGERPVGAKSNLGFSVGWGGWY